MQLILAIVADQQQAAQLAALIDGRLAVDLVQAAEVGEGLLALEDRIPDLILTSPLMSPFDDGVLDEYLRELGPAGAHVQTLRIPVLSQAPKKTTRLGFSLRRRAKPEGTTPDGCEPKVFADEIAVYLARAADDKRHAPANASTPAVECRGIQDELAAQWIVEERWRPAYSSDVIDETAEWAAPEPDGERTSSAWRSDLLDSPVTKVTPAYEPHDNDSGGACQDDTVETAALEEHYAPVYEPIAEPVLPDPDPTHVAQVRLEPDTAYLQPVRREREAAYSKPVPLRAGTELEAETRADEPIELTPSSFEEPDEGETPVLVEALEEPIVVETPLVNKPIALPAVTRTAVKEPATQLIAKDDSHKATPSFKAALAAIRAAWGKPKTETAPVATQESAASARTEPTEPAAEMAAALEVDLTSAVELLDQPTTELDVPFAAVPRPFVPADSLETPDVYELSVETDMNEVAPSLSDPTGDRGKKPAHRPTKAAKAKSPPPLEPRSPHDEWGIFDPNRCGFAALVDKLDEVSDDKVDQSPNRKGGKARVISCS